MSADATGNPPSWLKLVLRHLEDGVTPGRVLHVEVRHDDWCRAWGGGSCNCTPEVESGARVDRKYGGEL